MIFGAGHGHHRGPAGRGEARPHGEPQGQALLHRDRDRPAAQEEIQAPPGPCTFARPVRRQEAFTSCKAMGTGWTGGHKFSDIEVVSNALGKPELVVHGKVREFCEAGVGTMEVSLTTRISRAWPRRSSSSKESPANPCTGEESRMSNIGSYDERVTGHSTGRSRRAGARLQARRTVINIGWYCSDRICQPGQGRQAGPDLGGHAGEAKTLHLRRPAPAHQHHRRTTCRTSASQPGERVCLFMDQRPRALHRLPRHPEDRAPSSQPLFSAFGEESLLDARWPTAGTAAIITQQQAPGQGAQGPRAAARPAATSSSSTTTTTAKPLREGEVASRHGRSRASRRFAVFPTYAETPSRAALHLAARPASPRARMHVHCSHLRAVPHAEVRARPAGRRRLLVHRRPGLGHRHLATASSAPGRIGVDAGACSTPASRAERWYAFDREAPRHGLVLGADGHPHADEGRRRAGASSATSPRLRHLC
ncbi:MAG: hypothetical protein MZW92_10020 [Comamonadaceae bacterium]|nr:hypothetical protein [Comamonadaceae bacterium]